MDNDKFDYSAINDGMKIANQNADSNKEAKHLKEMLEFTQYKADMNSIINYINNHFKYSLSDEKMQEVAEFLLNNCMLNDLLEGKCDSEIESQLQLKRFLVNSVSETPVKEEGKSKKVSIEEVRDKIVKGIRFFAALTIAGVTMYVAVKIGIGVKENIESEQINTSIGTLATGVEEGIVAQNTQCAYSYDLNKTIDTYDYDGIAKCIINVCEKNPELFDLTMGKVYFDLQERLQNADIILSRLKSQLKDNEELSTLYESIKDYDVFLDYLMDKNLMDINSEEYKEFKMVLYNYKIGGYSELTDDYQAKIDELIKLYASYIGNLEDIYRVTLQNMTSVNQTNLQEATEEVLEVDGIETLDGGSYGK